MAFRLISLTVTNVSLARCCIAIRFDGVSRFYRQLVLSKPLATPSINCIYATNTYLKNEREQKRKNSSHVSLGVGVGHLGVFIDCVGWSCARLTAEAVKRRLEIRIGVLAGWKTMLAGGHSMEPTIASLKVMLLYSGVGGSRVNGLAAGGSEWCLGVDKPGTLASGNRNCSSRKDDRLLLRRDTRVILRVDRHHQRLRGVPS